jgi:hypothetical protein
MKKILMAAVVVLVSGTPLASAATIGNMNTAEPQSRHCTYQGENWDLCRQDRHKNGGAQAMPLLLRRHHH